METRSRSTKFIVASVACSGEQALAAACCEPRTRCALPLRREDGWAEGGSDLPMDHNSLTPPSPYGRGSRPSSPLEQDHDATRESKGHAGLRRMLRSIMA